MAAVDIETGRTDTQDDNKEKFVRLLPLEKTLAKAGNNISTLTWFHGNYHQAEALLKLRSDEILKANPWLGSRLITPFLDCKLAYKEQPNLDNHFECLTNLKPPISRDTPLEKLGPILSDYTVNTKLFRNVPLWKVIIIPCHKNPEEKFAVVHSMNHVIGDGHTFYHIQNMLLNWDEPVQPLIVERMATTVASQTEAMGGKKESHILSSIGFLVAYVIGVILSFILPGRKAVCKLYLMDIEAVKIAKEEAMNKPSKEEAMNKPCDSETSHSESSDEESASSPSVQFVSTNDVMTSSFFQACEAKHGMMAMNFRNRMEGLGDLHAGNYENNIYYRPEDFASPALIRKSVTPEEKGGAMVFQRRATQDVPINTGLCGLAFGTYGLATNWVSFCKPCSIPHCQEELHMPLFDMARFPNVLPPNMINQIVFRAGPERFGVLLGGTAKTVKRLETEFPFLAGPLV
ncbi:expressed unknown protein [Seminavis robusta]|uniref:Uncharacterized protein n=1 Tax=Seminavis robusta TaxID=568900 RepID=A0A9N8HEI6_9STRA|nr:expressed unknown protein [Seminavis robusta]|eukprot:Sro475_g150460.1 n/a (460) ;mRNA; f:45968-47347